MWGGGVHWLMHLNEIRHTWYQNEAFVYVTFYQRDLKEPNVKVHFEERNVRPPPPIIPPVG
jgi:hypothetical protein